MGYGFFSLFNYTPIDIHYFYLVFHIKVLKQQDTSRTRYDKHIKRYITK